MIKLKKTVASNSNVSRNKRAGRERESDGDVRGRGLQEGWLRKFVKMTIILIGIVRTQLRESESWGRAETGTRM
jgi:hypothetical protein